MKLELLHKLLFDKLNSAHLHFGKEFGSHIHSMDHLYRICIKNLRLHLTTNIVIMITFEVKDFLKTVIVVPYLILSHEITIELLFLIATFILIKNI